MDNQISAGGITPSQHALMHQQIQQQQQQQPQFPPPLWWPLAGSYNYEQFYNPFCNYGQQQFAMAAQQQHQQQQQQQQHQQEQQQAPIVSNHRSQLQEVLTPADTAATVSPVDACNPRPLTNSVASPAATEEQSEQQQQQSQQGPPFSGFKCKICQKLCFSKQDLQRHNSALHKTDARPHQCDTCGRQFATAAYLGQHRRIHTGLRPYGCKFCEKRFTQLSHVQQHERVHTGDRPYRCWHCSKSFAQMSNLQSHQRQHQRDKPHRCAACRSSFDTKDELDTHTAARHGANRYTRVLLCRLCGKAYNSETYLAKHLRKHEQQAGFSLNKDGQATVRQDEDRQNLQHQQQGKPPGLDADVASATSGIEFTL